MKIPAIKEMISKAFGEYSHLTNLYLNTDENGSTTLRLGIFGCSTDSLFKSSYIGHIEMDLSGRVTSLSEDVFVKMAKLQGVRIDLLSFEQYYQLDVYNRPRGVEDAEVLGVVTGSGEVTVFNLENAKHIEFKTSYITNNERVEKHGGNEYASFFKSVLQNVTLKYFKVQERGIRYFSARYDLDGFSVELELSQFFSYGIKVWVYSKGKTVLKLENEFALDFMSHIEELKNPKTASAFTKALVSCRVPYSNIVGCEETNKDEAVVEMSFSGKGAPTGKYQITLNFKTNSVKCNTNRSKVFIPKVIRDIKQRMNSDFAA